MFDAYILSANLDLEYKSPIKCFFIIQNNFLFQVNYPSTGKNRDTIHVGRMGRKETARLISPSGKEKEDFYQTATTPCDSMVISENQPRRVVVAGKQYMVTHCEIAFVIDTNQTRTIEP